MTGIVGPKGNFRHSNSLRVTLAGELSSGASFRAPFGVLVLLEAPLGILFRYSSGFLLAYL